MQIPPKHTQSITDLKQFGIFSSSELSNIQRTKSVNGNMKDARPYVLLFYSLTASQWFKVVYISHLQLVQHLDDTNMLIDLTFSLASGFRIIWARCAIAPASTTVCASSGECLLISLSAEAAMRFRDNSGSWIQSTSRGTAPASITAWANSAQMCMCTRTHRCTH